jgi:hypothetical protein
MKNINEEDLKAMIRKGLSKAFQKNAGSLPNTGDATTDNFVSMGQMINAVESELDEEKGYSPFLKSKDNPKGETEGLTVDTLNQILMRIVSDMGDEEVEGETTEAMGAGSSGAYSAPLFTEPKKNNLFQPGTESKLTTKPEGGPVNESELRDFEKIELVRKLIKAASGPSPMKSVKRIIDDIERKLENKRASGVKYVHGVKVEEQENDASPEDGQVEPEEVDTNDSQYDFYKSDYDADSKTIVGAYMVGEETPKQLEVFNIRQYPDNDSFFASGHQPYSMSLHRTMLPLSQIEVIGDVPGKEGFKFIRIPYWLFKKKDEDLRIQRMDNMRMLYLKGRDRSPESLEKLFDPMFEKYFEQIVYDEADQKKYEIAKTNYKRQKDKLNEGEIMMGGIADGKDIEDIAMMHDVDMDTMFEQLQKGVRVEMEHTSEMMVALEIAMDHLYEDPFYYDKLAKMEGGETTEVTSASSSGAYDAPFGFPKRDPLKIDNPETVDKKTRAVRDKKFPKYGGPGAKFVKIKSKCKKFPYCNQGDINALEFFERDMIKEAIDRTAKKLKVETYVVKNLVAKELGYITEQDEEEGFVTFELPDGAFPSKEEWEKEWLESIKDEKSRFLRKELKDKEFDFDNGNISGKIRIDDVGPEGKIAGFLSSADSYDFGDSRYVGMFVELLDLRYKGEKVPVGFYDMIARYLPPEEEEDSYRGNPVEQAIATGLSYPHRIFKSLNLHLTDIRINPYSRFR